MLVGIPTGDRTSFTASLARRKELSFRPVPTDARAADLFETLDHPGVITHRYALDRVEQAFQALSDRRGLKVIVTPAP